MIVCYINKRATYPAAQSDIKVTLLNPFIKDGDEKTMEVVFPLSIAENMEFFGPLNRLDTHFSMDTFDECRLVADGIEIISGKGTVTSVTNTEVKLQIMCGKTYLRFRESFDNVYLNEIDYGGLEERHQVLRKKVAATAGAFDFTAELSVQGFVGEPGKYAFMPVYDEVNDLHCNTPVYYYDEDRLPMGRSITFPAVQLNLMFVMRKVMERLGYSVLSNYYDADPWNKIYIANARMTTVLNKAMPHWSAYKFLDEFRKLFNATFIFDEQKKTVDIMPFGNSETADTIVLEPLEEFSTSFDEEGIEYLGSSNLEYKMTDNDRDYENIPQDVRRAFGVKEYDSITDLYDAFGAMTEQEKLTSFFHCPTGFYYGIPVIRDDETVSYLLRDCGCFSPLVRQEGGTTVDLNIVPVAVKYQECRGQALLLTNSSLYTEDQSGLWRSLGGQPWKYNSLEMNVDCPITQEQVLYTDVEKEDKASVTYVTVQDVMEDGESLPDNTSEDVPMEIFFVAGILATAPNPERADDRGTGPDLTAFDQPIAYTNYTYASLYAGVAHNSLGLNPVDRLKCIGSFHNRGIKIRQNVNGNNEICIRFLFNGKPDPKKIYLCRNKRYLCSKIDMAVRESGIDQVKTGYFYEIID